MIVKMLTHVHLLVHTLWCWHALRRRWSLKSRERMGSSLPPAVLARNTPATSPKFPIDAIENMHFIFSKSRISPRKLGGIRLFEKMKCIFSIAPIGNFGEVAGVFLAKKHSPDAGR